MTLFPSDGQSLGKLVGGAAFEGCDQTSSGAAWRRRGYLGPVEKTGIPWKRHQALVETFSVCCREFRGIVRVLWISLGLPGQPVIVNNNGMYQ